MLELNGESLHSLCTDKYEFKNAEITRVVYISLGFIIFFPLTRIWAFFRITKIEFKLDVLTRLLLSRLVRIEERGRWTRFKVTAYVFPRPAHFQDTPKVPYPS